MCALSKLAHVVKTVFFLSFYLFKSASMKSFLSTKASAYPLSISSSAAGYDAVLSYPGAPESGGLAGFPAVQRFASERAGGLPANTYPSGFADAHPTHTQGQAGSVLQMMFKAGGQKFPKPADHKFTAKSALAATQAPAHGAYAKATGQPAKSGVTVGDIGSYGAIKHLEQKGDQLTGDHQPSGAAIKEAIRLKLHAALNQALTRSMAQNAYKKAITVVVTDEWHKAYSRTYGGRNTPAQIAQDAKDLKMAAEKDWELTVPGLQKEGLDKKEIAQVWLALEEARAAFFKTGQPQFISLG
jgi:hypothetical protein